MIKSLKILLWGEEIGRLAWDERRRLSYFTYHPEFIKKGLNISPLVAPIDGTRGLLPVWVKMPRCIRSADCQEVFRRMVFKILANNTDDHNKNFSFVMSEVA